MTQACFGQMLVEFGHIFLTSVLYRVRTTTSKSQPSTITLLGKRVTDDPCWGESKDARDFLWSALDQARVTTAGDQLYLVVLWWCQPARGLSIQTDDSK